MVGRWTLRGVGMAGLVVLFATATGARSACVPIEPRAPACDTAKISFTKENVPAYDFYEICVPATLADPEALLGAIDPTLYCGVAGGFVGCDRATEIGCHGDLARAPGSRVVTDAGWEVLCRLAAEPSVRVIGGGHWVR